MHGALTLLLLTLAGNVACGKIDISNYFQEEIPGLRNELSQLKWSKTINTNDELSEEILTGESNMIKANVVHNNVEVACIEPKDEHQESSLPLCEFLQEFQRSSQGKRKGLLLHLKTQEGFNSAIKLLQGKVYAFPVWLHMNIGQGPGGSETVGIVDPKYTLNSKIFDLYTTSVGLTTGATSDTGYTEAAFKNMTETMNAKNDFYAIRGVYLMDSWKVINGKFLELKPLLVFAHVDDVDSVEVVSLRNLLRKHRRFYFRDLPQALQARIDALCAKKHDLYDFTENNQLAGLQDLKFHEDVKSLPELQEALSKPDYHVIKANVEEKNGEVFVDDGSFELGELLGAMKGITNGKKALKLHFWSTEAFEITLQKHGDAIESSDYPIWFEADVVEGPSGVLEPVDLNIDRNFVFLSCHPVFLGLTSTADDPDRTYTRPQIDALKSHHRPDGPLVTYSLRAVYVWRSKDIIDGRLVNRNDAFYLWSRDGDDARTISADLRHMREFFKGFYLWDMADDVDWRLKDCPRNRRALLYFELTDPKFLTFGDHIDSEEDFHTMLEGDVHMLKARVFLYGGTAHVGEITRFPLQRLLQTFNKTTRRKGLILRFKTTNAFEYTVNAHHDELRTIAKPMWLYVDVAKGPGGTTTQLIDTRFLANNDAMDCCTMLYGWSTDNGNTEKIYTEQHAQNMNNYLKGEGENVYAIRAEYTKDDTIGNLNTIRDLILYTYLPKNDLDGFIARELRRVLAWNRGIYVDVAEHYLMDCAKNQDAMEFFGIGRINLTKLAFSRATVQSEGDLNKYLNDENVHMIKVNVEASSDGLLMVTADLTLDALLLKVDQHANSKGVEITFADNETVQAAIKSSLSLLKRCEFPIWLRVYAAKGPGAYPTAKTVDLHYDHFNDVLDCRTILQAWITDTAAAAAGFTQEHIDDLAGNAIWTQLPTHQSLIVEVRGEFVSSSWPLISEHFDTNYKIWIPDTDEQSVIIAKDLREATVDIYWKSYVDIPEELKRFLVSCPTKQDIYLYFWNLDDLDKNATRLQFHESVGTLQELEEAILSGKHIINIEVYEKNGKAVVNKVPGEGGVMEVPLGDLLDFFSTNEDVNMGIQLLFKSTEAFVVAIKDYYTQIRNMNRPIWINANIIKGPGDDDNVVHFDYEKYNDVIDCRTMVLGWTTRSGGLYTKEQIEEMQQISLGTSEKVYSVRMVNLVNSWGNLEAMRDEKLLLWASAGDVDQLEVEKLRSLIESNEQRLFLDVTDGVRKEVFNKGATNDASFALFALFVIVEFVCTIDY